MKRKNVIISALVLAIALTGCSGKKVDYNMETENINTKAGSDISAFDDSTKWNDSFSVEISDKSVDASEGGCGCGYFSRHYPAGLQKHVGC